MSRASEELDRLIAIMERLRSETGCPWDREQTLLSLRPYLIEEAYEVLEQLDRLAGTPDDPRLLRALCEELGDLLLQIVFQAQLCREKGQFELADAIQAIGDKLERRHPHVFGSLSAKDADEVSERWVRIKAEERKEKDGTAGSVLDGVPRDAPSLLRAERLTEKAGRVRFDFRNLAEVRGKVTEELAELDKAIASGDRVAIAEELGDTLFALANLGRWLKTPPEDALRGSVAKFVDRFHYIEARLREAGRDPLDATLEELDALWDEAKGLRKGH